MDINELKQLLVDNNYEDVVVYENPDYANAFVGVTNDGRAVYDYYKMIDHLVDRGMDPDEAMDFIAYNASFGADDLPLIIYMKETMV